jgi:hypothetical protein
MKPLPAALLFVSLATTASPQSDPAITFRSDTYELHFGASSGSGGPADDLRTEDLQIEDARRFYPALEVAPLPAPAHYTFLIDMSESLEEEIRSVRDAALALARQLGARDTFSLISFDETCSLRIANTSDRMKLQEEFDRLLTLYRGARHSLTSVEAGIKCAINHARSIGQLPDQVIFVFSDGLSSVVEPDLAAFSALVRRSGVIVHCIHFGGRALSHVADVGFERMARWAEATGGRALTTDRAGSIGEIMKKLQALVVQRYRLRYSPEAAYGPGLHTVKIIDRRHPEYFFSFVPVYFSGACQAKQGETCQLAGNAAADYGVQVFPPPGMRMAPLRVPITDEFDFSNPGRDFVGLFARVGSGGLFNFHPEPVASEPGIQTSMTHLIQSRGIPNIRWDPEYTDYSRPFCLLQQDDSHPVQTPSTPWEPPFLAGGEFEVSFSPPEESSWTWPALRMRTRALEMRFAPTRSSTAKGGVLRLTCHLPLQYEIGPGTTRSNAWTRPPDAPTAKTAFTWKTLSGMLVDLFAFDVARFQ